MENETQSEMNELRVTELPQAFASEAKGHKFESCRAHQTKGLTDHTPPSDPLPVLGNKSLNLGKPLDECDLELIGMAWCPACAEFRCHSPEEWLNHPLAGHGYTREQGWSHPELKPEVARD